MLLETNDLEMQKLNMEEEVYKIASRKCKINCNIPLSNQQATFIPDGMSERR